MNRLRQILRSALIGGGFGVCLIVSANVAAQENSPPQLESSYFAHIAAANSALRLNEAAEARRWLAATPGDHRTWEWRYLHRLSDTSMHTLKFDDSAPLKVDLSPTGSVLAVAHVDGFVSLFDTASWTQTQRWRVGQQSVYAASFSPDGTRLGTCTRDGKLAVWNAADGTQVWEQPSGGQGLADIAWSPDGTRLLFCSWYRGAASVLGIVSLWDVVNGEQLWKTDFGVKPIVAARFSRDGKKFAVGTWDALVGIWDAASPTEPQVLDFKDVTRYSAIDGLDFHPQENILVAATKNGSPRVWNLAEPEKPRDLHGANSSVFCVVHSPDGRSLFSGDSNGVIGVWDLASGELIQRLYGHEGRIGSLCIHPDGGHLVSSSADGSVRVWSLARPRPFVAEGTSTFVYGMTLNQAGTMLATGGEGDKPITIWSTETYQPLRQVPGVTGSVNYLDFGGDALLACGNWDGDLRVIDASSGETPWTLDKTEHGGMQQCAFSEDGQWLAVATSKNQVAVWHVPTRKLAKLLPFESGCWGIDFHPASTELAVGDGNGHIHVYTVGSWESWSCAGNEKLIAALKFSPDGKTIAAGSDNGLLCMFDAAAHRLTHTVQAHTGRIWSLDFLSDGSRLATGSGDRKVRLWDVNSAEPVLTISDFPESIYNVKFSADGTTLFVNSLGSRLDALHAPEMKVSN